MVSVFLQTFMMKLILLVGGGRARKGQKLIVNIIYGICFSSDFYDEVDPSCGRGEGYEKDKLINCKHFLWSVFLQTFMMKLILLVGGGRARKGQIN